MNLEELSNKVDQAIEMFFAKDLQLLELGASEWTVANRIAIYLATIFDGWDIDCEYNRVGLDGNTKHNANGDYTRPDIVVHHRGLIEQEHNLLVIEMKIKNTTEDYRKLRDFTSPPCQNCLFQYQFGLALSFEPRLQKQWFPELHQEEGANL